MELAFVTGNAGKVEEARAYLGPLGVEVVQDDRGYPEVQADELETVARAAVDHLRAEVDGPFLLDDAGLFVDALDGFPGVYSSYAYGTLGLERFLRLMDGEEDRSARFEAVLAYAEPDGEARFFHGTVEGRLATGVREGPHGFGYDPVFVPAGREEPFSRIPPEEKNALSHRGEALRAFRAWLEGSGRG